jgi:branched-chain amino acid transport system substrate-binding protein
VFTRRFGSKTRAVIENFEFAQGDLAAFPPMIERVKELAPDGVYIATYVDELVELLRLLKEADVHAVRMSSSSATVDLVQLAGEAVEGLVFPQPSFDVESTEPAVASFVEAYRARYGKTPDQYAAHGHDALKLMFEAIERGASAHPDDVKRGLYGIEGYEGAAGRTSFDDNGDVVRYPRLVVIDQGRLVPYREFVEGGGTVRVPPSP